MKKVDFLILILVASLTLSTLNMVGRLGGTVQALEPTVMWSHNYGDYYFDEKAYSVVQTSDGGYLLAGTNYSYPYAPTGTHALLLKTDSSGNMQWNMSYAGGGYGGDFVQCVVQTSDGGYAFAGYTQTSILGYQSSWLVKTDSSGNQVWSQTYTAAGTNYAKAYSVVQTSDGGYALAGTELWKTDSGGNVQWWKAIGVAYSVVRTSDGGYALAGGSVWKTDSGGNVQWSKPLYDPWVLDAYSIIQTSDGGYAYAGDGGMPSWPGSYLAKTDSNGNMQWNWNRTSGVNDYNVFRSVVQTSDGGYAVTGSCHPLGHGKLDFDLLKTDSNGGVEWEQYYGGALNDEAYCVIETSDGGLAVAGYTNSYTNGGTDMWLIKLSAFLPPPPLSPINVKTWYWTDLTVIKSVASGDVDGDGKTEIVTGGYYWGHYDAQLCVWDSATLTLKNVKTWYWGNYAVIYSVAVGDVDGDGNAEIVTGGFYNDGTHGFAQLCVWNGATLALKNVKTWYWTGETRISSVAVGDVDGDGNAEIVTGGFYNDGTRNVAQLCVWNGVTLALKNVKTWYWAGNTYINSVAIGDVDADGKKEIVTGGSYNDGTRSVAQLCVWDGTLTLKNVKTWYWTSNTGINSVAVGDVDGDSKVEIVTGGFYNDNVRNLAQLCVWDGATLALKKVKAWYWTGNTAINSVAVASEIVTGGSYNDGTRDVAQLCVWA